MNLAKLFDAQRELGKVGLFAYKGEDRFNKLVLALLVELGECANEWRGFKFWSKDQSPRLNKSRAPYMDLDDADFYNPLLEEYVDKLHFVLELGIELEFDSEMWVFEKIKHKDITTQFIKFNQSVTDFWEDVSELGYAILLETFFGLGEMLGFTWEQIESAYFEKNKVNHQRQDSGY